MDEFDMGMFRNSLSKAIMKVYIGRFSKIETYIDCKDKEYKVIIEEISKEK